MSRSVILSLLLAGCVLGPGCATRGTKPNTQPQAAPAIQPVMDSRSAYAGAPGHLLDFGGDYARPITTGSRKAQRYFNQGLIWI